jgi:hypothetical protein
MARRGRKRWSNRVVVEDCLSFDIANLVRAGVFRANPGTLCSSVWKDADEQEIFRANFWVEMTTSGKALLQVRYGVPSGRPLMHYAQSESVEIVQTPLYFGPRYWFLCPGVHNSAPCRRRTRILYFPPNASRLGCRKCHNLIYTSAREHDARIGAILRLPIEEFREVLHNDTIAFGSLASRAARVLRRRLEKKVARYSENRCERNLGP